jgi:hypothetical protein
VFIAEWSIEPRHQQFEFCQRLSGVLIIANFRGSTLRKVKQATYVAFWCSGFTPMPYREG